ncbi:hypothetical protein BX600DRAFT_429732 [Xylariales sp. PMI_506]|nr:hypothetical protein BX600DRAFT_429732 [Xylariales sp. PMI_506]
MVPRSLFIYSALNRDEQLPLMSDQLPPPPPPTPYDPSMGPDLDDLLVLEKRVMIYVFIFSLILGSLWTVRCWLDRSARIRQQRQERHQARRDRWAARRRYPRAWYQRKRDETVIIFHLHNQLE